MPHGIIIGGGFAGLKAAVELAGAGWRVSVVESRAGLGGRARSFVDPATSEVVDNGQHLFLAGYPETIAFLNRLGTRNRVVFQDHLRVCFAEPGGKVHTLNCPKVPSPWYLMLGVAGLSGLSWKDKAGFLKVVRALRRPASGGHRPESAQAWLNRLGQSPRAQERFWNPLVIAALNELPEKASAVGLRSVLQRMLLGPWPDARLGVSSVGLSDLYAAQARGLIEKMGGQVFLNRPVAGLEAAGSEVTGVRFADAHRLEADAVLSTVSPGILARLLPERPETEPLRGRLRQFKHSPILSVNLWLDAPVTEELFVGLLGTRFQWLFNKPAILRLAGIQAHYLSLILSAAYDFIGQSNEALVRTALEDLEACFPSARGIRVVRSQVVREREATVSLDPAVERLRPGPESPLQGLFLAGDWTSTGLPATIESAVISGRRVAEAVLASTRVGATGLATGSFDR